MPPKIMTVVEVRVPVSKLRRGMFVCRLDKEWVDSTFLFQGFLITNDELIEQLKEECDYVFIDENRGLPASKSLAEIEHKPRIKPKKSFLDKLMAIKKKPPSRKNTHILRDIVELSIDSRTISPPTKLAPFDEEMPHAEKAHTTANALIKDFMAHVKRGGPVDIIVAKHAVYDCMSSILRSPDAMLLLTRLKTKNYSLWQHSMNVSVLAISLGRYLNLHDDELIVLGLCGMFHDIGKLKISNEVLMAANTKKELQAILDSHTILGRDILLKNMGQLAEIAAQVAYSHHEHLDGSGFPQGLQGAQINSYTRMISIINTYDDLTTSRPGKKGLTHYDAMTILLERAGKHFDPTLVDSFNRCIGTYPVGCAVEMNTGEIAVIVEENEEQRLRPKIMLLTNAEKEKIPKKVVNLAELEFTSEEDSYFIKAIVDDETYQAIKP
jgi:HD-GYP domain-containing protein (c-di-GMP phosphodiesterase class II)